MNTTNRHSGFTLIEIMIVVGLIGILLGIVAPRMGSVLNRGNDAKTKGNLAGLRSSLSIYYSETEGEYPNDNLSSLTLAGKFIREIPDAKITKIPGKNSGHSTTNTVTANPGVVGVAVDGGGWLYPNNVAFTTWGRIIVNCSHLDAKDKQWNTN